ncbi:MAG: hypothetical protein RLZZ543_1821 [Bacteroidota bacterium]|jgi:hypothetical protein
MKFIRPAQITLIALFSAALVFHFLVLGNIIPFEMVWGGRIQNREQLIGFEAISILTNLYFLFILCLNANILKGKFSPLFIRIGLWIMFVLFLLNTIGNLLSLNSTEKWIMTPITAITALLSAVLLFSKKK